MWCEGGGGGLSGVYVGQAVCVKGGDCPVCTWGRWCGVKEGGRIVRCVIGEGGVV